MELNNSNDSSNMSDLNNSSTSSASGIPIIQYNITTIQIRIMKYNTIQPTLYNTIQYYTIQYR